MSGAVLVSNLISGVLLGGDLALTALGLSLVLGVMRVVNLAHGEFLIGGAYLGMFMLQLFGIDPLVGLLLIGLILAVLAYPIQKFLLSPLIEKGVEAPMMTAFGLSVILQNVYTILFSGDTRSIERSYATEPLVIGSVTVAQIYVIGFAISVVIIVLVHLLVSRTGFGRDLRAAATDPTAAGIMGVDVKRVYALTFALGAACAGVGGTLIGLAFSFTPTSGSGYLLTNFAIMVLGGLGNIFGTLIGGMLLGFLQSLGGVTLGDGYRELVGLVIFLGVLAVKPQGLLSRGRI
ncbi:MAG TPA: branched-chain amino acid ABC transporter permease [Magnetospirillaceae bacterium]|jgi:branched-chain amino acid transport system permease protein